MAKIKGYFITGLIAIIPIVATIAILFISLHLVDSLLSMPVSFAFGIKQGFLSSLIDFFSGIFITLFVIVIAGYITTKIGKRGIFRWIKGLMERLPIVNSLYAGIKQLVDIFILNKAIEGFARVVLVEYPRKGLYAIGFVTGKGSYELDNAAKKGLMNIYLPNSLDLASGFFIVAPEEEVVHLDISVEEGFKMAVSAGLIIPKKWQE